MSNEITNEILKNRHALVVCFGGISSSTHKIKTKFFSILQQTAFLAEEKNVG